MIGPPRPSRQPTEEAQRTLGVYGAEDIVRIYASSHRLSPAERVLFDAYVPRGARVLDLGVGGARTTPRLAGGSSVYVGIDISPAMIDACRSAFPDLDFRVGDAADLAEFGDAAFDVVVFSYNGLDHVDPATRRLACLRECHRVLDARGRLILSRANPRALVACAQSPGSRRTAPQGLPHGRWQATLVRTARQVTERAFWTGKGPVRAPPGFLPDWEEGTVERADVARHGQRSPSKDPRDLLYPSGYVRSHFASPGRTRQEVAGVGFEHLVTLGSRYPRPSSQLLDAWYYHAFAKSAAARSTG